MRMCMCKGTKPIEQCFASFLAKHGDPSYANGATNPSSDGYRIFQPPEPMEASQHFESFDRVNIKRRALKSTTVEVSHSIDCLLSEPA